MDKIKCDTHTHTLYSRHGYSTIEENVRAAAEQGLELLASTDHFSDMLYPEVHIRHYQYLNNQTMWPRNWHGITLLRGVEADIIDLKGHLFGHGIPTETNIVGTPYGEVMDLDARVLMNQDYAIASVHGKLFTEGASLVQTTEMYVKALENPKVLILGHIGRAGVPFDTDEVLLAAKSMNKLIEINEHSFDKGMDRGMKRCREIAERCGELGVQISVATDAHVACYIGKFEKSQHMLEEIHFPQELVADLNRDRFLRALAASGVCDPVKAGICNAETL